MDISPWTPDDEPTDEELAEIERESRLLDAELALLDAELRNLSADGDLSDLDWYRLRRTLRDVLSDDELCADDSYDDEDDRPEDDVA